MATITSYEKRRKLLESERSSFISLWKELSDYVLAHRGRFLTSDRNKGYKRNTKQYNNHARKSSRTLASGMMAGITSPARPWFRLAAGSPELNELTPVKHWLTDVQSIMYKVFSESNTYNVLHNVYSELGTFGTAPMGIYMDFDNVIWCKAYTAGSYSISQDAKGNVNTFYREYEQTVAQVVTEFGYENCSNVVQGLWDKGNTEAWVKLVHLVEPNDDRDMQSPLARDMPYRSVYYEVDSAKNKQDDKKFLRQSGFRTFPVPTPRWEVAGEDVYATDCPGMTALGDIKALQLGEKRLYQAIDKVVNPPLEGDAGIKGQIPRGGPRPGDIYWRSGAGQALTSIYGNWRPDLNAMGQINREVETRISESFFEDLFLMLINSDRRQITAREVAEKQEEKLLMLGPVLERLHAELLDPLIDRTFDILMEAGVLPAPPPELEGVELRVEYVSILAQAQRMVAVAGIDRLAGFAGNLVEVWPDMRHKINAQQMVDEYAEALGVNPRIVRGDDEVEAMVQRENEAQRAQQAMEQGEQGANIAKTLSDTQTQDDNALNTLMKNSGLR